MYHVTSYVCVFVCVCVHVCVIDRRCVNQMLLCARCVIRDVRFGGSLIHAHTRRYSHKSVSNILLYVDQIPLEGY